MSRARVGGEQAEVHAVLPGAVPVAALPRGVDDVFLVLSGRATIQLRDRDVELETGDMFVVPAGVEHRPKADAEAVIMNIEPSGTAATGDAEAVE